MRERLYTFTLTGLLFSALAFGQDVVDINLDVKHVVNGISELDRSKYMMIHASAVDREWPSEAVKKQFLEDYDVYLGRNNGSMPWYLSICAQDPDKPGWPSVAHLQQLGASAINSYKNKPTAFQYESRRGRYMMGGQEGMYPNQTHEIGPSGQKWYLAKEGYAPLAEYYANFLKYFHGTGGTTGLPQPAYVEVMNEPFVKSGELGTTNANLSQMHAVVARRIKELNPLVKVGGYSAAHPAYEAADFKHWETNWKLFIDIAGDDMDFFALHLYDNIRDIPSQGQYRAGSNIEAILDMVEHYGYLKYGYIKPFNISEYGCLSSNEGEPYTKERDWNNIRSFSTIMMQLLEKQDVVDMALPFLLLKANWWNPDLDYRYAHRLFRQKKELEGESGDEWVYTEVVKFFQLWSDVKGTRIDTKSSNLDTQVDTYIDGNKAYVIVNNMHHEARFVDLYMNGIGDANVQSVYVKHLHAENAGVPALDESTLTTPPDRIQVGREATAILEYTFDQPIEIPDSSSEAKYYADIYFQEILANQQIDFNLDGVTLSEEGEAVLRLGCGRDFGQSLQPIVAINGTAIPVPTNLRGDDQKNRDRFFGVLEIPVPYEVLKENNLVSVTFPDGGGHVSSLTMQVFTFSREISRTGDSILGVTVTPDVRVMKPGKQIQLEAEVSPGNFENRNISWHSTDATVATVSDSGLVHALTEGFASIVTTTEVGLLTDTCHIEVSSNAPDILAESVRISPRTLTLVMSHSSQLMNEVLPLDVDNKSLGWESLNPDIASVNHEGMVTGEAIGITYIRARTQDGSNLSDSVWVNITPLPNKVDCSPFPDLLETDSVITVEVNYTLGESKDVAVELKKTGVTLPWVAENQVTLEPGAGTALVTIKVKDRETGVGVFPITGNYILEASIRDVGGDRNTNSARCFKPIYLLERDLTGIFQLEEGQMQIYPNPAGSSIQVSGAKGLIEHITIYNMQGLACLDFTRQTDSNYDISTLARGVYLLKAEGNGFREVSIFVKN